MFQWSEDGSQFGVGPRWGVAQTGQNVAVFMNADKLRQLGFGGGTQAEREDVGVVPAPRTLCGCGVATQRCADAGHLVGGDRGAGPGPAADDRLLGPALGDVAGSCLRCPGPVVALLAAERPVHEWLVAAPAQLLDQRPGHPDKLVSGDRDAHAYE